jgi:23S rRNA (guanosine2251-2'-O)-methyltransferase
VDGAPRHQGAGAARGEWIYGRHVVQSALATGARRRTHRLAATLPALKAMTCPLPPGLPVDTVATGELDRLTGSRDHQGIALEVEAFRYASAEEVLRGAVVMVLDEVSDPRNVGAVARSALAAGAGGLVLPKHRSASVTPAAVKASAGTIEHLPVTQATNIVSFLKKAKDAGFWVYGAAGGSSTMYLELDLTGRIVLVFGAEGRGLRPLVARTCDALVAIPMDDPVESLNVSVAAALLLFEARRQRGLEPPGPDLGRSRTSSDSVVRRPRGASR